jgi:hypothetical protein
MRLSHATLAAFFALSGLAMSPVVAANEVVSLENGFNAASAAASLLKPSGDEKLAQGLKRVAITGFDVEFATHANASASATEIGHRGTASTSVHVKLTGLSHADYQAIVDKLYADFASELKATGVELVPLARLMESEHYRKMVSAGAKSPHAKDSKGESLTVYTAEGRAVTGTSLSTEGGSLMTGLATFGSATTNVVSGMELQKELDATLLNVRMVVRFADLASSSKSFLNRISGEASVRTKLNPMISAGSTTMSIQNGAGMVTYILQKPLQINGEAIPELRDTSSVATNVGLAVLNMAIGNGSRSSVSEKEAIADPGRYRELVGAGLGTVRELMIEKIKKLK